MAPRQDGYHPIESVFQEIDFYDEIVIERSKKKKHQIIFFNQDKSPISINNSSLEKVLDLYLDQKGPFFNIKVSKYIPMGSGLGGASSNAAVCIRYLIENGYSQEKTMHDIAFNIGADTPFFLRGGTCFVEGIGEKISKMDLRPNPAFLLMIPPLHVSSVVMYQLLDKKGDYSKPSGLKMGTNDFYNDFQSMVWKQYPIYKELEAYVSEFNLPLYLSGSGAACYVPLNEVVLNQLSDLEATLKSRFPTCMIQYVKAI